MVNIEEIADLSLEEFENMKDQVAYLKDYRNRQIAQAAYQKSLEAEIKKQEARRRIIFGKPTPQKR